LSYGYATASGFGFVIFLALKRKAVSLLLFVTLTSALAASSNSTTSLWPFVVAKAKVARRLCPRRLASARFAPKPWHRHLPSADVNLPLAYGARRQRERLAGFAA
jgi:hypothetical protein